MQDIVYKPAVRGIGVDTPPVVLRETWEQICLKYGTRKTLWQFLETASENEIIYTVPDDKVFLLVSACIQANGNSEEEYSLWLDLPGNNKKLLAIRLENALTHGEAALAPCIPIKMIGGEALHVYNGGDTTSDSSFEVFGYEIDRSLFDKLI